MATLRLDGELVTREPLVEVDSALPAGRYIATLVVVGDSGQSEPARVHITVARTHRAPAPRRAPGARGRRRRPS